MTEGLAHALKTLEFDAVRRALAAHAQTPMGEATALHVEPWFDAERVWAEQSRTAQAYDTLDHVPVSLEGVTDVREPARKAERGSTLDAAVLYRVGVALQAMRGARAAIEGRRQDAPLLWVLAELLPNLTNLENRLLSSVDGDGTVRSEASIELGNLRAKIARAEQRLVERIQSYTTGRSRELLSDAVFTQREGRYVIPLKAENRGKIKGIVHDTSGSGQTIYLEPEDVVALGNAMREAVAAERAEVERVLAELSAYVGDHGSAIRHGIEAAGELDLLLARARHGMATGGCLPRSATGPWVRLTGARHPLLQREQAVPLSLELGGDGPGRIDAMLITGPNTGGKTVAIKCVGLCIAMAQSGLMPPADEMRTGCFTQIWADIGDEQSLQQSLSTFSGHIRNIARALNGVQPGALVLLDEIGAGTDPGEGAALAKALLLAFQKAGAKVLASTHYGELKVLASNEPGFMNSAMEFDQKSLRPTYRLMVGMPGSSHALKIAERYGVPKSIVEEAREGVGLEHQDVARMIEKLEQAQRQAQRAQSEADRLSGELRKLQSDMQRKLAEAEEAKRAARTNASKVLEEALREIRLEAEDVFEAVKAKGQGQVPDEARRRLKELQAAGQELASTLRPAEAPPEPGLKLAKGCAVRIEGLSQSGTLLDEPTGSKVQVQVGAMKMTVDVRKLTPVPPPKPDKIKTRTAALQLSRTQSARPEIHLRAMRAEDALEALERFIDAAVLAGLESVRVVHGKGEGILRQVTQDYLRRHRHVKSYREAEAGEGGQGVTVAVLK